MCIFKNHLTLEEIALLERLKNIQKDLEKRLNQDTYETRDE